MTVFATPIVVRFRHCDPAGIVFYPRYFEMLNDIIEDWCAAIGWGFEQMMGAGRRAIPMKAVEAVFLAPSRLGEALTARVAVTKMGRTSCALSVTLSGPDGKERVRFAATMVCVDIETLRPEPWPEDLRAAMQSPAAGVTS